MSEAEVAVGAYEDPVVADFLELVSGDSDFAAELEAWCENNCLAFQGCRLDGEHPLEFTQLHAQYVAMWEASLDAFLAERQIQAKDLVSRLLTYRRRLHLGRRWVPAFVTDCEYQAFFENMVARAERDSMICVARAQCSTDAASDSDVNLSGIFQIDLSRTTSVGEIDHVTKRAGVPFPLRKLYCKAVGRLGVVVNHAAVEVQLQVNIPFFGGKLEAYVHDGVQRAGRAPVTGGKRWVRSWREGDVFRTAFQVHQDSFDGADILDLYYQDDSRNVLCVRQTTYYSDGENGEIVYAFMRQE